MKIILICETMQYLSGSPLYHYTLALELKKRGYDVHFLSQWAYNPMRLELEKAGVKILEGKADEEYDLALISQRTFNIPKAKKVLHIIHSEYEVERPRTGDFDFIAIRPSIKEHLIKNHGIKEDRIKVIYNGVDLERFKPREKKERDYTKVVIPATIDSLRQKFFDYYIAKASDNYKIYFFGKQFGGYIPNNPNIIKMDEVHNIEDFMYDADLVAGILLGRVNLEARAMNIKSMIHNPNDPEECEEYYPDRKEFEERHDIKNVANQIIEYGR